MHLKKLWVVSRCQRLGHGCRAFAHGQTTNKLLACHGYEQLNGRKVYYNTFRKRIYILRISVGAGNAEETMRQLRHTNY